MSERDEPQSPLQQTADCNLTLILNVSIINPLPDGRLCGNTWLICLSFYPSSFSTHQKPLSSEIQNTSALSLPTLHETLCSVTVVTTLLEGEG